MTNIIDFRKRSTLFRRKITASSINKLKKKIENKLTFCKAVLGL